MALIEVPITAFAIVLTFDAALEPVAPIAFDTRFATDETLGDVAVIAPTALGISFATDEALADDTFRTVWNIFETVDADPSVIVLMLEKSFNTDDVLAEVVETALDAFFNTAEALDSVVVLSAYSGEDDRAFRSIVTAAHCVVLRA